MRLRRFVFDRISREALSAPELLELLDRLDKVFEPALEGLLEPWNDPQPTKDFFSSGSAGEALGSLEGRAAALIHRKARGWINVAGTRMCLMDIPGGWLNVGLSIMMFAGQDTLRRAMFEAGRAETFSRTAVRSGYFKADESGFREAVETYSEAGFGDFQIQELNMTEGFARITCRDSFEGWSVLNSGNPSRIPVCFYSSGVLLSFLKNLSGCPELVAAETRCIAKGDSACEFVLGTEQALREVGVSPAQWGPTIKEKASRLERMLKEKKRIEGDLRQRNEELSVLHRISVAVNQTLDLEETLKLARQELSSIVGDKGLGIYILDRNRNELVFTSRKGISEAFYREVSRIKVGEGMTGRAAAWKEPLVCDDYSKFPHALESARRQEKIQAMLSVPLVHMGEVVGVFNVVTRTPYHFSSREVSLLTLIGNQIGSGIQNARLHEEIKESEHKYKTLVEGINEGYVLCQGGQILFSNPAFASMHGYAREDVNGKRISAFLPGELARSFENATEGDEASLSNGKPVEFARTHRNGLRLPTEVKIQDVEYEGRPALVGIFRDISEQKQMEKKLMEQERLASIGRLSTNVAHEIRNPLSAIKMNIQILSKNLRLTGYNKRHLEIALGEIRRLDHILVDLMDIARPVKMEIHPTPLKDVIDRCLNLMEEKLREQHVLVMVDTDRTGGMIPMDAEKIQQVVLNVILNALDAMPDGGTLSIRIDREQSQGRDMVRVVVADTGDGIAEEHVPHLFDPFFSTKNKGAGLGLSNVKKIMEAHQGTVEVESRPGRGACFRLFLPAV
ncbi:MAG: GAF domain-containing protein [Deltaproteobacteria bacterium]|nr:GAF domain-containing protein [Deltaproteobacteria bacterium]